jgi:hypothetical protein
MKRLPTIPTNSVSSVVEHMVGVPQGNRSPTANDDLAGYGTRWFGQPLARSAPSLERKVHPQTTPPDVAKKVVEAALKNPIWGCCKLAEELKRNNILISSPTVQKILIKLHMGSQRERAARLMELNSRGQILTPQQSTQVQRILRVKL